MKSCSKCNKELPLSEFGIYGKNKDGSRRVRAKCNSCKRIDDKEYLKRPEVRAARRTREKDPNSALNRSLKIRRALIWEYLKTHPCIDCGEKDPIVLEFDHIKDEKVANISKMVARKLKLETIIAEIEKCEIRCANCHRRVTYKRENSWRISAV